MAVVLQTEAGGFVTKKNLMVILVLLVVGCLAAYRYGIFVAQQGASAAISEVQLILAFNHMRRYQELHACLDNGKASEAKEKLAHSVINEKELVAQLLSSINSSQVLDYIEIRASESLDVLRSFKSSRGSKWVEPACQ